MRCCWHMKLIGNADVKLKLEAANQLKDNLENYTNGQIYANFLKKLVPILTSILKGPPVFVSTSAEQVCVRICCDGGVADC